MRPHYTASSLLSARDLNDQQNDVVQRLRRHDRFAHGSGVVCGLQVYAAASRRHPWRVGVCPGYAVGPCGDEIEVASRVTVDVQDFAWSRPFPNGVGLRAALVGLRFADDAGGAGHSSCDCGCGCSSAAAESASTMIGDSYAVDILWSVEETPATEFDLCKGPLAPCPAVPTGRHVLLAILRLPAFDSTPLTDADVFQL